MVLLGLLKMKLVELIKLKLLLLIISLENLLDYLIPVIEVAMNIFISKPKILINSL